MKYTKYQGLEEERNEKRRKNKTASHINIVKKNESQCTFNPFYLEAKKSLGQNFLKNTTIIKRIVDAGEITKHETVVEIGPGTGELTFQLLTKESRILAIEKDKRAIPILEKRFKEEIKQGKLILVEADFLKIDLASLFITHSLLPKYKIIANIPYYITGLITRKSLEFKNKPETLIFLVQKEVAERITKKDKKGSIMSHSICAYGKAEILCVVSKGNFVPPPKVDSAVLIISNISDSMFTTHDIKEVFFFDVLHAGFGHKRKKLIINLLEFITENELVSNIHTSHIINPHKIITKNEVKSALIKSFEHIGLTQNSRPEELDTEEWFKIAKFVNQFFIQKFD